MLALTYYLNVKVGSLPAVGKLLNPFTGFWQNGETADLDIPDEIKLEYLNEEASIVFDELLIPHIYAKNDHDVYFLQGYITAYHRLFQMDFSARATAGRLSEVLGKSYLNYDRSQRRKGLSFGAERLLEEISKDPATNAMLVAYAQGINAYIDNLSPKNYGVEYKLLNTSPEKWSPYKTCLMMKSMANMLSRGETDLENTNMLKLFGKELFDELYPDYHPNPDPIIPVGTPFDFEPVSTTIPINGLPDSTYLNLLSKRSMDMPNPYNGSNSFVVGPNKTSDGSTILSNEPDLSLTLPSIWYIAHLSSDELNSMGSTIPGMPGIIIGFNENIAWGNTNAPRDLVDWYQITYKNDLRDEYKYDDKWLKTDKRIEKIEVSGADTFYDTVIYTHYGPVAYDRNFLGNEQQINFAMRWTAHDPSMEFKALYEINRAKNYDEFVSAFNYFDGPPQNYSFADRKGNIALWINGKYPIKWPEQGKFVLNGANSAHEWMGFIPRDQNIHIKNPERGFVSSANQHPADSTYPYYIYDRNYEYYRGRRLNDRLKTMEKITVRDVQKLQNDNFNYIASENLNLLLDSLDSNSFSGSKFSYFRLLKNWDFFNDPNLVAPSVFELWQDKFINLMWDEFRNEDVALRTPPIFHTFYFLKKNNTSEFYDIKETSKVETAKDLINEAFIYAVDSIESWQAVNGEEAKWYLFKNTTVKHIIGIPQFSVDKVKIGGNHNIVNAASGNHGPSWRMVVNLSDKGIEAWGTYPGSQTGNVGNPKYGHWIDDWAQGKYTKLEFSSASQFTKERIIKTIKFTKE